MPQNIENVNSEFNIILKKYSKNILGYRVVIDNCSFVFLNENHNSDVQLVVMNELIKLSKEYHDIGFILLYDDFKLFIDLHYHYNKNKTKFVHTPIIKEEDNVIDFNALYVINKVAKERGINRK